MGTDGTNSGIIWRTTSVHGNTIYLYEEDWNHALEGHPEMVGQEEVVRRAVERPVRVREAAYASACTFERPISTNPEGIRVLVDHEREMFLSGGVEGHVTTAFPINTRRFNRTRVGPIIAEYPENADES